MSKTAYLVLENGTVFEGKSFGAEKETTGELVFTTAMTGYLETLTDPSYYGQVIIQTFPLIGNYGVIPSDFESEAPILKGYIVREWCQAPSNFRSEGDLDTFLKEKGVPGVCGIDTRALTRIVREYGVLNCKIQYTPEISDEHKRIFAVGRQIKDIQRMLQTQASFLARLKHNNTDNCNAGNDLENGQNDLQNIHVIYLPPRVC